MGFTIKKIGKIRQYNQRKDLINRRFLLKTLIVAGGIFLVLIVAKRAYGYAKIGVEKLGIGTSKIISKQFGEPMQVDDLGNINALIVGYSGISSRGGFLTDTIMVASYNPSLGVVTFLSIPRDLFVDYEAGRKGRINGMYRAKYLETDGNVTVSSQVLLDKIKEITGLDVPYYMMIDFAGFTRFIDTLGGIEVEVLEPIYDTDYPGPNNSYETFQISSGSQVLSGDVALKYARSRKSTSDFSRTLRQQQIIKGVIKQIVQQVGTMQLTKLQEIYTTFSEMMITNVSMKQMIGVLPQVQQIAQYFSFVYSADCDLRYLDLTTPGCVLQNGERAAFGGAAVLIPEGASYGNLSYYKKTQDFAFWVTHHQEFLMEQAEIGVFNGIDKAVAKSAGYNVNGVASEFALDLKIRGFNVVDIDNTEEFFDKTVLYLPGYGWYPATVEMLKAFVDIAEIRVDEAGLYSSGGVTLILGQEYVNKL